MQHHHTITSLLAADAASYDSLIWLFIIVFALALIIYLLMGRRRLWRPAKLPHSRLSPEIWFYSVLVDIEIGAAPATARHLQRQFFVYLQRRYNLPDSKPDTAFELVKQSEKDPQRIELYGNVYNEIISLKQKPAEAVIAYARQLKKAFNQGVAQQAATSSDCNNC
ncbi:MAG: hypothetical protein K8R90_05445 [Candidatus Cloacimonetes bacterium]|nr:hypothetical protein [Candidatus Cloacimonadota bacterium]